MSTLLQLANENAFENRAKIVMRIASACATQCDLSASLQPAMGMLRRGNGGSACEAYGALLTIAERIEALVPAVARGSATASHEVQALCLIEHALRIAMAVTPAEIQALADAADERLALAGLVLPEAT